MITQETIDKKIRISQEEIALAEKYIEELAKRKQELQEFIESLNTVEAKQEGRARHGELYGYIDDIGQICSKIESGSLPDEYRYEIGNYYLTPEDARVEVQIRLFRLLDRFSRQNGWTDELWEDSKIAKHYIYFDNIYKRIEINNVRTTRHTCQVYFPSVEIAQQAIDRYRELIMEVMVI